MSHSFTSKGMPIDGLYFLTPSEVRAELEQGALLVDIREAHEIMGRTVAIGEVLPLPRSELAGGVAGLPDDRGLILADSTGVRARAAALLLAAAGIEQVAILAGGVIEWHRNGLPTDVNAADLPIGSCACRLTTAGNGQQR